MEPYLGFDGLHTPGERVAPDLALTDAQGGTVVKDEVLKGAGIGRLCQNLEKHPGTAFFHLRGKNGNVKGARIEQLPGQMTNVLGRVVIDVGFENGERFGDQPLGAVSLAEKQAKDIRNGKVAAAGSITERSESHGRNGAEAVGNFRENRRARRGDQFGVDLAAANGAVFHQGERCGERAAGSVRGLR